MGKEEKWLVVMSQPEYQELADWESDRKRAEALYLDQIYELLRCRTIADEWDYVYLVKIVKKVRVEEAEDGLSLKLIEEDLETGESKVIGVRDKDYEYVSPYR